MSTTQQSPPQNLRPVEARGEEPPPLLAELAPEQFHQWRRHPVTELLLARYLPDFRHSLERIALNGWEAGTLSLQQEQVIRGHILAAAMLTELTLDGVRQFYGLAPWVEAAAAKGRPRA